MKARSQERSGDQEEWAVLGLSSGKRMVLFKGGGEPVGVTAPDRPAVGVAPSGESVFMFPTIVLPSGRGFEGPEMFLLLAWFVGAESSFAPVTFWCPLFTSETILLPTR